MGIQILVEALHYISYLLRSCQFNFNSTQFYLYGNTNHCCILCCCEIKYSSCHLKLLYIVR